MKKTVDLPKVSLADLSASEKDAVVAAMRVQKNAYAPYSNYHVGVAVVSITDQIYTGVNVENVHYKVGHAEEYALGDMAKHGERQFKILVCSAKNGGIPCMSCRQTMREFSGENLDAVTIIGVGEDVKKTQQVIKCTFADIIGVDSFGPADLGIDPSKF
ncbi:MAG: cytidine deaminase [bacterium]|nr:cytidine deaminase [bacterium]